MARARKKEKEYKERLSAVTSRCMSLVSELERVREVRLLVKPKDLRGAPSPTHHAGVIRRCALLRQVVLQIVFIKNDPLKFDGLRRNLQKPVEIT